MLQSQLTKAVSSLVPDHLDEPIELLKLLDFVDFVHFLLGQVHVLEQLKVESYTAFPEVTLFEDRFCLCPIDLVIAHYLNLEWLEVLVRAHFLSQKCAELLSDLLLLVLLQ